ncbi:MAG: sodium/proline symporter [Deltaproteobacteria bacterium]|nr:sodium/proline symporter [Deltaproteobacteria bacterium]
MTPTTTIFLTFGVYMLLLLGIGVWADRRFGSTYEGFLSAGRSLGAWVSAISSAASSESGWVMLGLSGLGYKHGLAAYWASLGCSLGFIFTAIFVIRQLRASAARYDDILTLGDYLAARFGAGARALRSISATLITVFMLAYVVAQFTAAGKQMAGMNLLSYQTGVWMGALIIGIYVLVGGYAAVCWTDLIQGLLMLAVLVAFPVYALVLAGGFSGIGAKLAEANLMHVWVGGQGMTWSAVGFALTYVGFGLGYPGMPHSVIRFITIRDDHEAKAAAKISAVYGTLALFGSASLGIAGRALFSPSLVTDPEKILPAFTATHFPPVISGMILAAVSAAIMSTADSQLMLAASSLTHDLWYRVLRRRPVSEKSMTWLTRGIIAALTLVGLFMALAKARVIDTLVLFAWGCLGAAFSPVIVLALYWKRFNWAGAVASFIVGPVVIVVWQVAGLSKDLHGLIPGTALSFLAAIVVTLMTPSASPPPTASPPTTASADPTAPAASTSPGLK